MEHRVENGKKFVTIEEKEFLDISVKVCGMYCGFKGGSSILEKLTLATKLAPLFSALTEILFDEKEYEEFIRELEKEKKKK